MLEKYKKIIELIPKDKLDICFRRHNTTAAGHFMKRKSDKELDMLITKLRRRKDKLEVSLLFQGWTIDEHLAIEIYIRLYGTDIRKI